MRVRSRHHLRSDAVRELETALGERFGVRFEGERYELVEIAELEHDVVLVDGEPFVFYVNGEPVPTIRGANAAVPESRVVVVDAGAIPFVSDGADVMRPGIVDADTGIEPEDIVLIAEENHGKVLAVGRARVGGDDMQGEQGKVIDSIHHVGDKLFGFDA